MKATVVLIISCFLAAAAILLLPALLAPPVSRPPTAEEAIPGIDRLTPLPEVVFTPIVGAGGGLEGEPTARIAPLADVALADTQAVPAPSTAASREPTYSPDTLTPDIPDWTPIPAAGAQMSAAPVAAGATEASAGSRAASLWAKTIQGAATGVRPYAVATAASPIGAAPASSGSRKVYTGVSLHNAPWNMNELADWESTVAGKSAAIVHYWVFWKYEGRYQPFEPFLLDSIRSHGSIPMLTWAPEDPGAGIGQSDFQLIDIIRGGHDAYIRQFAADARLGETILPTVGA